MLLQVSTSDPDKKRRRLDLLRRKRDLLLKKRQQAAAGESQGVSPARVGEAPPAPAPTTGGLEALQQQMTPRVSAGRRPAGIAAPAPDEPSLGTSFRRGILQKEVETSRQEAARQADIVRAGGQRSTSILRPRRTRAGQEIAGTGRGRGRQREVTKAEALEAGRASVAHAVATTKEMEALPKSAGQREVEQAVQEGVRPLLEAAVENPGALVEMSVEQLPRSLLPGLLTFAGAVYGPMGIALGAFLGSFSEEETAAFSGYLDEELARRGKEGTPDDVMELLLDAEAVEALRSRARGRGLGVGIVEGSFALVTAGASRLVSPATTAVRRAGRVGVGLTFETTGEVASEFGGQFGGGEEISPGDAALEGLLSGTTSATTVGASALRNRSRALPGSLPQEQAENVFLAEMTDEQIATVLAEENLPQATREALDAESIRRQTRERLTARSRSRTDEALAAGGFEALRQQEVQDEGARVEVQPDLEEAVPETGVALLDVPGAPESEVGEVRPVEAEELAETLPALARRFSEADTATEREAIAAQIQQFAEFQEAQARFEELLAEPSPTAEQTAELAEVTQTIRGGRPLTTQETQDAQRDEVQDEPQEQQAEALIDEPPDIPQAEAEAATQEVAAEAQAAPVSPAPVALPTEIRATREAIERTNDLLGIEQLPPATRRRWGEAREQAQREGKVSGAEAIAQGVLARNDRILTDVERIALVLRKAQTEQDLQLHTAAAAQLAEAGDTEGHANALRDYDAAIERLKLLDTALVRSGTLAARSLASTQFGLGRDAYSRGEIEIRGIANKGKRLTGTEKKVLRDLVTQIEEQTKRIAELESAQDSKVEQRARELAQQQLARMRRTRKGIAGVRERRQSIKERIAELGLEVTVGLNPEQAFQIGRLIATYVEEGTLQLPEIIARTRSELPTLNDRDVVDVLAGRFNEKKNRSNAQQSLSELKKQSRLVAKIEDEIGVLEGEPEAEAAERAEPSATVASLRTTLNELTESVMREQKDTDRLAAILGRLDLVREAIARGEVRAKRERRTDPADIQEAQQALNDARRIADIETDIRDLEQQLETGEFKVPTERARREATDEMTRARARLRSLRNQADRQIAAFRPVTPGEVAGGIFEIPRNLLASLDIGGVGRQGAMHAINPLSGVQVEVVDGKKRLRLGAAPRALAATVRSIREEGADFVMQRLTEHPLYNKMLKHGLGLVDPTETNPSRRERIIANNLFDHLVTKKELQGEKAVLPLRALATMLRASERNMVMGLNVLRAELFADFIRRNPQAASEDLDALAYLINVTTGRGLRGGDLQRVGTLTNRFLFSPQMTASRFVTPYALAITAMGRRAPKLLDSEGKPIKETRAEQEQREQGNKSLRTQVARDAGGMILGAGALFGLATLAGADVDFDPESGDFLKVQFDNTRIDFLGGFSQVLRLSLRYVLQTKLQGDTTLRDAMGLPDPSFFAPDDGWGLLSQVMKWKLTPSISAFETIRLKKDPIGRDIERGEAALRTLTPIVAQETVDGMIAGGPMASLAGFAFGEIGWGISTFDNPMRSQSVEAVTRKAQYQPQMSYPDDASKADKDALRDSFKADMATVIKGRRDELLAMEPEGLKKELQREACYARKRVRRAAGVKVPKQSCQ